MDKTAVSSIHRHGGELYSLLIVTTTTPERFKYYYNYNYNMDKNNNFSEKEIEDMKDTISEKEIMEDEDLEQIKNLKKSVSGSDVNLAKLFIKCYDFMSINTFQFKDESRNFIKKIEKFLQTFDVSEIRRLVNEYGDGKEYGSYVIEENIKKEVHLNRKRYLDLIKVFFRIFGEEE